jgi:hypothetical protein
MKNYYRFFCSQQPSAHVFSGTAGFAEKPQNTSIEVPVTPLRLEHLKDAPKASLAKLAEAGIVHVHELLSFREDAQALGALARTTQVPVDEFCLLLKLASRAQSLLETLTSRLDGVKLVFVEDDDKEQTPTGQPQTSPPGSHEEALVAAVLRCLFVDGPELGHASGMPMANAHAGQHQTGRSSVHRILVRPHEPSIHVLQIG